MEITSQADVKIKANTNIDVQASAMMNLKGSMIKLNLRIKRRDMHQTGTSRRTAARVTDSVVHLPPMLGPGPGSMNVLIGSRPAWRGCSRGGRGGPAGGEAGVGYGNQGGRSGHAGGGGNSRGAGGEGGGRRRESGGGRADGVGDHERGRRRRHSRVHDAVAHSAAWSRRRDRWFADGADQQPARLPHGRHGPRGRRAAEQDRGRRDDSHHRRITKFGDRLQIAWLKGQKTGALPRNLVPVTEFQTSNYVESTMGGEFLGVGWNFPLEIEQLDGTRRSVRLAEYEESIRQSIRIILETARGERVMRPDFGCGIHERVFALNDSATRGIIADEVREALLNWEPRIDVLEVDARAEGSEGQVLLINIEYKVRSTDNRFNLVYPFYLNRSVV